jgi:flagellar hook-associated protein 2
VSSPITFSGFNNIDFNTIVNALMQQASQPLTDLQNHQSDLQSQVSKFSTLSGYVSAVQSAAGALGTTGGLTTLGATSSDTSAVAASVGTAAVAGHYDVVVNELARAQVTASASTAPDANTTVVAQGGTLTIGGKTVTISSDVTLQGLADAINATSGIGVTATVVQSDASAYRLVLTSNATGQANGFTITNALTGGAGVTFTDTDLDGISGDSDADNAVKATDADILVNNIDIKSASNTLSTAIPGVTLTLYKKDPAATISVDVAADGSALKSKVQAFVTSYNNLVSYANTQTTAAGNGDTSSIGRDPMLRSLRSALRSGISSSYGSGTYTYLSQVGVEFTQDGTLQLNEGVFDQAVADDPDAVASLFTGASSDGAFSALSGAALQYSQSGGLLSSVQTQLNASISRLGDQIDSMTARLLQQRTALQAEFTAADAAMTQLKSQSSSLSNFNTNLTAAM